jgi:gas vesicle protein
MNSSGKVLLGVLAGVAVGATLGILFAPDKGSKTRKKIADKSNDYADELTEKFNEFLAGISGKMDDVVDEATEVLEKSKRKFQDVEAEVMASVDGAGR